MTLMSLGTTGVVSAATSADGLADFNSGFLFGTEAFNCTGAGLTASDGFCLIGLAASVLRVRAGAACGVVPVFGATFAAGLLAGLLAGLTTGAATLVTGLVLVLAAAFVTGLAAGFAATLTVFAAVAGLVTGFAMRSFAESVGFFAGFFIAFAMELKPKFHNTE